jgi:hypothetical protein
LDNKFDEFFSEYDDENLGGLDCEEIEGAQVLFIHEIIENMSSSKGNFCPKCHLQ